MIPNPPFYLKLGILYHFTSIKDQTVTLNSAGQRNES